MTRKSDAEMKLPGETWVDGKFAITLVIGLALTAVFLWWQGQRAAVANASAGIADGDFRSRSVVTPDGSWCDPNLATACVRATGEIHIPDGDARKTLPASYFSIREKMVDAPKLSAWGLLWPLEDHELVYLTKEVNGQLSSTEALERMLAGSGLISLMTSDDMMFIKRRSIGSDPENVSVGAPQQSPKAATF